MFWDLPIKHWQLTINVTSYFVNWIPHPPPSTLNMRSRSCTAWLPWKISRFALQFQLCELAFIFKDSRDWFLCGYYIALKKSLGSLCKEVSVISNMLSYFPFSPIFSPFEIPSRSGKFQHSSNTHIYASTDRWVSTISWYPYFLEKEVSKTEYSHSTPSDAIISLQGVVLQIKLQHNGYIN